VGMRGVSAVDQLPQADALTAGALRQPSSGPCLAPAFPIRPVSEIILRVLHSCIPIYARPWKPSGTSIFAFDRCLLEYLVTKTNF
jgi:hypothetical protein